MDIIEQIVRITTDGDETRAEVIGTLTRCKDCKHWVTVVDHKKAEYGLCDAMKAPISATPRDGFCSRGERKETENEEIHNR